MKRIWGFVITCEEKPFLADSDDSSDGDMGSAYEDFDDADDGGGGLADELALMAEGCDLSAAVLRKIPRLGGTSVTGQVRPLQHTLPGSLLPLENN